MKGAVPFILILLLAGPKDTGTSPTSRPAMSQTERSNNPAVDPHWSADGCRHCHEMDNGKPLPIAPANVDALCLRCHDGKQAAKEHHPIGRSFSSELIVQPEGWPVVNGQLGCGTCHRITEPCKSGGHKPRQDTTFLRDYDASNPLHFCSRCHLDLEEQKPFNPHLMLNPDGTVRTQSCRFCHTEPWGERSQRVRTGKPALRTEPIVLCVSCHTHHIEFFEPGHIGAKMSEEMKSYLLSFERRLAAESISDPELTKRLKSNRDPLVFPLADGDTVVCSTCHNPHQSGLFGPDSVLSLGEIRTSGKRSTLGLRSVGEEVCIACHKK